MRLSSRVVVCGALALIVATSPLAAKAELAPETRARIDEMASRPVRNGEVPGLIVGVMQGSDRMIRGYGESVEGSGVRPTKDTIWEIGSITKTFTAMLLALYVQRGVVHYDDPLQKYVPDWVTVPSYEGRQIKLIDLATHTSGLPKDPILRGRDHLSVEEMYRITNAYQLTRTPGERFEYSNWGFALLAHALMRATGEDYEPLVESNICAPLGLLDTRINLTPDEAAAKPKDTTRPGCRSRTTTRPGLRSTVRARCAHDERHDDLSRVQHGAGNTPLSSSCRTYSVIAMRRCPVRMSAWRGRCSRCAARPQVIWKNGAASGFFSYIGFVKETGTGVVVIANRKVKVGKIAIQILRMLNGANIIEPEPVEEPEESSAK